MQRAVVKDSTTDALLRRIRGEFLEMPGLRLTERQIRRLWDLDAAKCQSVLRALVDSGFLKRAMDGTFIRSGS